MKTREWGNYCQTSLETDESSFRVLNLETSLLNVYHSLTIAHNLLVIAVLFSFACKLDLIL